MTDLRTRLLHAGRAPLAHNGVVNIPVHRASTIVFEDTTTWAQAQARKKAGERGVYYGRLGTPTSQGLEDALNLLEGAEASFLFPSGLAAIYHTLAAFAQSGKRFVLAQNCYEPSRKAAVALAARTGMTVDLFDPMDLPALTALLDQDVALVLFEAPGSNSFEVCDVAAIAAAARAVGAVSALDNTWATGLLFQPLAHGVDLSVQALTKYVSGHSDLMGGAVSASGQIAAQMKAHYEISGACLGADDCYAAAKGLRTLAVRLERHGQSALTLAHWLAGLPQVMAVRHPALPEAAGHAYWAQNFAGASGLFAIDIADWGWAETQTFIDALALFGLGASWGGYESLILPCGNLQGNLDDQGRSFARLRLNIGLEDPHDLQADLAQAFEKVEIHRHGRLEHGHNL